ncbi:glycine cleavage system protein GcvH [Saxibacter everestensis]|uniref:Glycine cleavage system H protein n=1 Tax=Saxibacter everestensis TaxID=2909229 RepID=A0ABY8QQS7_9MICO|nr:glycine cleavage system protein GcvH [Brevibacteriaceae bacterium ZFBP1038]
MSKELPPLPENFTYSKEHEWVEQLSDGIARVGITAVATDALGEIVFVEPPQPGTTVTAGDVCGEVESTKSVSDVYSPVSGEVVDVNAVAVDDPAKVNSDPYGDGWLFTVKVSAEGELMSAAEYGELNKLG